MEQLPINTVAPVISGLGYVGYSLSVSNGTWTGSPSPAYTYQWKRNGVDISGATSKTYSPVTADLGTTTTVTVIATNMLGSVSASATGSAGPNTAPPPTIPIVDGLIGWWDSSVTASLTLTGANVEGMVDQSGAGNHMGPGAITRPTYSATGFNTTKPGILFNNTTGTGLVTADGFPMGTGNTLTMWYVGTMPTSGGTGRAVAYPKPGSNDWNNIGSWGVGGGGTNVFIIRNSVQVTTTASASPAGHRFIATVNGSGLMTFYVDGVAAATGTAAGNWVSAGKVGLGFQPSPSITDFWGGTIAEAGIATGFSDATAVANSTPSSRPSGACK